MRSFLTFANLVIRGRDAAGDLDALDERELGGLYKINTRKRDYIIPKSPTPGKCRSPYADDMA